MNEQYFTELNGYYVKDKNAIHTYDTVASMKADSKLKEGQYAKIIEDNKEFIIKQGDETEVDGENGVYVLSNGYIAELVKTKNLMELNPSITDNEVISNLTINNSSTTSGTAGIVLSGQENVTIEHNDITGGYWSARIGNENDDNDTTGIKLINNNLTSRVGMSLRQRRNQTAGGEHTLAFNEINNTASNPGVESWAKEVQILFNRIKNISGSIGGTGGITLGAKPNQMAIGNYVENFGYGIEIGNSNSNIVSGNFIKNCTKGIVCSSDNTHNVIISNNIIKIPANGDGIYLRSGDKVTISNCVLIYGEPNADYNDSTTRSGRGIYSDTYPKNVQISNCVFINIANVSLSMQCNVTNCTFINCRISSTLNNQHFTNCTFINTRFSYGGVNNKKTYFENCYFEQSSDSTANQFIFNGRGNSTPGIAVFNNCITINCDIITLYQNSETGGSDIRFLSQKIDGIYYTYNKTQLSNIKSDFETMGYTLQKGDKIIDNYNNRVWEIMTQNRQISYQPSIPTTGAFVKGDRIYNNFNSSTTVDYWLCTATGEFGTTTEPTFVAKNV